MKLDTKQKILLTLIIIALAYVVWQIYGLFAPSTPPIVAPTHPVQPENPNARKNLTGVPTPVPKVVVPATPPANVSPPPTRVLNISAPLTPTQAEYLRLLNHYQIVKMRRMVMEEEAAIAASQAKIAELNQQTSKITGSSQSTVLSMSQTPPLSTLGYQLVYIDYQNGQWTATLNIGGQLVEVIAGVRLSDGARIIKIDQRGVVVRRAGTTYLLNFYGTSRLTSGGTTTGITMPSNYAAPVAKPVKVQTRVPPVTTKVKDACPPAKPCERVKPAPSTAVMPVSATPTVVPPSTAATPIANPPANTLVPHQSNIKPLTIIPNTNTTAPATTTTSIKPTVKPEESKTPVIIPQKPIMPSTSVPVIHPATPQSLHQETVLPNHKTQTVHESHLIPEKHNVINKTMLTTPTPSSEKPIISLPPINYNPHKHQKAPEAIKKPNAPIALAAPVEKNVSQLKLVRAETKRTAEPLIIAASTPKEATPKTAIIQHETAKTPTLVLEPKVMPLTSVQQNLDRPKIPLALTPAQKDKVVQLETLLAVKPSTSDAAAGKIDDQQLLKLPADHYTIQLMASNRLSELSTFSKNHNLDNNAYIYHTFYLGKDWYILVYGVYPTEQDALKALATLPTTSQHSKPWVRTIASVHAAIKRQENEKTTTDKKTSQEPILHILG